MTICSGMKVFSKPHLLSIGNSHSKNSDSTSKKSSFNSYQQVTENLSDHNYVLLTVPPATENTFEDLEPLNISFILQPVAELTVHQFQEVLSDSLLSLRTLGPSGQSPEFFDTYIHGVLSNIFKTGSSDYSMLSRVEVGDSGRHCDFVFLSKPQIGNHSFIVKVLATQKPVMLRSAAKSALMMMERQEWARELMKSYPRIDFVFRVSIAVSLDNFCVDYSNETIFRPQAA
ncbi:uncharacterized protein [Bemisia tabaci]|uniref:uncharacterized protein isoform X2 n=1 Tax=Bemisia tabaci TaxID=7038 RepID=UPI003B28BE25